MTSSKATRLWWRPLTAVRREQERMLLCILMSSLSANLDGKVRDKETTTAIFSTFLHLSCSNWQFNVMYFLNLKQYHWNWIKQVFAVWAYPIPRGNSISFKNECLSRKEELEQLTKISRGKVDWSVFSLQQASSLAFEPDRLPCCFTCQHWQHLRSQAHTGMKEEDRER